MTKTPTLPFTDEQRQHMRRYVAGTLPQQHQPAEQRELGLQHGPDAVGKQVDAPVENAARWRNSTRNSDPNVSWTVDDSYWEREGRDFLQLCNQLANRGKG